MVTSPFIEIINECINSSGSRMEFWAKFLHVSQSKEVAELGVWKGDFAAYVLKKCSSITRYYMIDPWRHLDAWNKPANVDEESFESIFSGAMTKTKFAEQKISVLRGKTTEVIDRIPDESLDFVYIDGDHTLKGISIDLIRSYPKVKPGCIIGGDDFSRSIWQHSPEYEPTLVFPFAVYFAEATGSKIYALPYGQFLIRKQSATIETFSFEDLTGRYDDLSLRSQFLQRATLISKIKGSIPSRLTNVLKTLLKR